MHIKLGQWEIASKIASTYMNNNEINIMYINYAQEMLLSNRYKDAEKLYLTVKEYDLAIGQNYDPFIVLYYSTCIIYMYINLIYFHYKCYTRYTLTTLTTHYSCHINYDYTMYTLIIIYHTIYLGMYKKAKRYEDMIRLVKDYRADALKEVCGWMDGGQNYDLSYIL